MRPVSAKMKQVQAEQKRAYAAAPDAKQGYCLACGQPGETEHSHLYRQRQRPDLRNNPANWQVLGKHCGCHPLFEHKKAEFSACYPDCWGAALTAMREIDRQAYALFALMWAHLIPVELLP